MVEIHVIAVYRHQSVEDAFDELQVLGYVQGYRCWKPRFWRPRWAIVHYNPETGEKKVL